MLGFMCFSHDKNLLPDALIHFQLNNAAERIAKIRKSILLINTQCDFSTVLLVRW